jgi:hypothetical protein
VITPGLCALIGARPGHRKRKEQPMTTTITRRAILAGVAALPAASPAVATTISTTKHELTNLQTEYAAAWQQLERACSQLGKCEETMWSKYPGRGLSKLSDAEREAIEEQFGITQAHVDEEATSDELSRIERLIVETPARDIEGVAVKLWHMKLAGTDASAPRREGMLFSVLADVEALLAQAATARREA